MENTFRFTVDEWNGILHSATIAIAISLLSNILVMLLHLVMMRYKPNSVNRVSLRMIVLACLCNSIFCIFQSIIDDLPAKNLACGRIIHLVVAFDVMSCMSLAMIGLNLDLIFIAKVSQKHRWELMYYAIVILSGVIACVVPISLKKNRENPDLMGTCWYRFFFFSRMNNIFNWVQ
ncbi:hypothetical protein BDB01DRAFT_809858 [Pilobolus umbonatus]|nr:hypothetical protein BDB01DRAFT_809858 [Pilobolus umbonatus]